METLVFDTLLRPLGLAVILGVTLGFLLRFLLGRSKPPTTKPPTAKDIERWNQSVNTVRSDYGGDYMTPYLQQRQDMMDLIRELGKEKEEREKEERGKEDKYWWEW